MAFQQQGQAPGPPFDPASLWAARAAHWAQQRYTGTPLQPSPPFPLLSLASVSQPRGSGTFQMPPVRPLMETPRGVYPSGQVPPAPARPPVRHPLSSALSTLEPWSENRPMRGSGGMEEYREAVGLHEQLQDGRADYNYGVGQQMMFAGQPKNVPNLAGLSHAGSFERPGVVSHQLNFERPGVMSHSLNFEGPGVVSHLPNFDRPDVVTHTPNFNTPVVVTHPPNFGVRGEHTDLWNVGDRRTSGMNNPVFGSALEHQSPALATSKPVPLFQTASVTPSGADLAKKRLPAWIRDGLAKAGHDLQKKMYEGLVNKHQSAVQDVHDQEDHSVIEMEVVKEVRVDDIGARRISGYEQTVSRSPSPPTDKEAEDHDQNGSESDSDSDADFIAKVRVLLTEILLEITDKEVKSVAEEIVGAEQPGVYLERERTARGAYGGTGLSVSRLSASHESNSGDETSTAHRSLSTSAMADLTNYGSSSEEEEENGNEKEARKGVATKKSPQQGTITCKESKAIGDETEKRKHHEAEKSKSKSPDAMQHSEVRHHHHHRHSSKGHKSKSPPAKKRRSKSRSRSPVRHKKKHVRSPRRGHRSHSPSRKQSKAVSPQHRHRSKGKSKSKSKSRSRSPKRSHNRKRSRRS